MLLPSLKGGLTRLTAPAIKPGAVGLAVSVVLVLRVYRIATGLADMDVTAPATLTAAALDDACRRIDATMVFASPAALANVLATASRGNLPASTLRSLSLALADASTIHR